MSLSSLLLPKKIDKELDALFKANPVPPRNPATVIHAPVPGSSAPPAKKKRKLDNVDAVPIVSEAEAKKAKLSKAAEKKTPKLSPKTTPKATKQPKKSKRAETAQNGDASEDLDEDEDDSDLENAYLGKKGKRAPPKKSEDEEMSDAEEQAVSAEESEDDPDAPPPVHESLTKRMRTKPTKKEKIVPDGETSTQRDARTVFVGGLAAEIAQNKSMQKQLSRHLLSFLPLGSKVKIESTRFRSVAFRDPTSSNAHSSDNHASARASTWRQSGGGKEKEKDEDAEAAGGDKQYLTPAQKKKILFIQGAIHPEAQSVNAYVVLAHHSTEEGEEDTPYRAAAHMARAANASSFSQRSLRVDLCASISGPGAEVDEGAVGDPKRSVFVGNLDFGAREDDVREFFEGVVAGERGPAPSAASGDAEDATTGRWVIGVRLVRDRDTQLGKGFGYVRFSDRECVDEILALVKTEDGQMKLKFAKRLLRVQRCRAVGSAAKSTPSTITATTATKGDRKPHLPPAKRGDPALGARIAHLDKDARKVAKKADAARAERRAEKKRKMRTGPSPAAAKVKAVTAGGGKGVGGRKGEKGFGKGKERERERKVRVSKHGK
ncbi:hypothetical protein FB45DRAFT_894664 [Roridomyces roridus]|uniref:Nucleolar protein 12 n=1 Tax=Roridomyces roridus TaxID=1738132 RepID=A0AAD7CGR2_9AGAR|nr:hypothetical protein FB45DRAFT_894664 [Roridomyces roridus]